MRSFTLVVGLLLVACSAENIAGDGIWEAPSSGTDGGTVAACQRPLPWPRNACAAEPNIDKMSCPGASLVAGDEDEPPVQELRQKQGTRLGGPMPAWVSTGYNSDGVSLDMYVGRLRYRYRASEPWLEDTQLIGVPIFVHSDNPQIDFRLIIDELEKVGPQNGENLRSFHKYKMRYQAIDNISKLESQWLDLCPQKDWGNQNQAVALPGLATTRHEKWGLGGFYCLGGVAAKCMSWGYINDDVQYDLLGQHAAVYDTCVAMAMADYCGTNFSNTIDGTVISIYDLLELRSTIEPYTFLHHPPPRVVTDPVEALWSVKLSYYPDPNTPVGYSPRPICLSKRRWDTLPFRGNCCLADPRLRPGGLNACPAPEAPRFCEERTLAEWHEWLTKQEGGDRRANILLVNHSSHHDVGLYRWRNLQDGSSLTTSHYDAARTPQTPFASRNVAPLGCEHELVCFEGRLFVPDLPAAAQVGVKPLIQYQVNQGSRRFTVTTTPDDALASDQRIIDAERIGWLYAADDAQQPRPRLYRCQSTEGQDLSTTDLSACALDVRLLGFLLPVPVGKDGAPYVCAPPPRPIPDSCRSSVSSLESLGPIESGCKM